MLFRGISVVAMALMALAALMLPPAALALIEGDDAMALVFLQWAGMIALAAIGVALASYRIVPRRAARGEIVTVVGFFAVGPLVAAVPLALALPELGLERAYFEMVSTLTTTGMTAFDRLDDLPPAIHLWRALTAWLGGFVALAAAAAVFNPRNLGGYEVQVDQRAGSVGRLPGLPAWTGIADRPSADRRLAGAFAAIGPAYAVLTLVLALSFSAAGVPPLAAVVQAIGVMSTSGLAIDGSGFRGGLAAEGVALAFMAAAATRHAFSSGSPAARLRRFRGDPEVDLGMFTVAVAAGWVLLRGVDTVGIENLGRDLAAGVEAAWGAVFTATSFLATAGYVSAAWEHSHARIGLNTPSMLLLALAAMGGGVASTAGGVKLLRSFALFQHGMAEMRQLVHPSSVPRRGVGAHRVGFAGAVLAWLFLMLFLLALGLVTLGLSAVAIPLDAALAAAIAASTNTGPAYAITAGPDSPSLSAFAPAGRLILCAAMILGRVEVLAVVALANPAYWRRG